MYAVPYGVFTRFWAALSMCLCTLLLRAVTVAVTCAHAGLCLFQEVAAWLAPAAVHGRCVRVCAYARVCVCVRVRV